MPTCAQCHTSETPCWREGPNGARTLCNACGIRWKRLLGRTKRSTKRATPKTKKQTKTKAKPKPKPKIKPKKIETPIQKPPQQPIVGRTTRSSSRSSRKLFDQSTLASKNIVSLSQNELLDCILTRLEDLESSQTRTSLRVRVLTQRLMRQKQKQKLSLQSNKPRNLSTIIEKIQIESFPVNMNSNNTQDFDMTENVKGDALLASMREGTSISLLEFPMDKQ